MRVHDHRDAEGRVVCFEIPVFPISRKGVARVAASIPGAAVRFHKGAWFGLAAPEEFCEFSVNGKRFVAWEPWGDSSCYWIGPSPPGWCEEVSFVREAFARHGPWPWSRPSESR